MAYNEKPRAKIAERAKILHFYAARRTGLLRDGACAKESGAIVSIDIDNIFEGIEEVLPLVDVFISSAEFPKDWSESMIKKRLYAK